MAVRTKAARARGRASEAGPARTRGRVPARPPHLAPGRPRLSRRGGLLIAVGSALAGALVALAVPALLDRPDPIDARVAALERAEVERDARLARELVEVATAAHAVLLPVVDEIAAGDGRPPDRPTASRLEELRAQVTEAAGPVEVQVSGGTRVNLTRSGLAHAVALLSHSLDLYGDSATAPARLREAGFDRAERLRNDAVVAWSLAATALDDLAVEHDLGHVHLYLTDDPSTGAMVADGGQP